MTIIDLSIAYKYIAMLLMILEANQFIEVTGLEVSRTINIGDVQTGSHIGPYSESDFSASLLTSQYLFGFGWGHLATFRKRGFLPQDSPIGIQERNIELAKYTSVIDTAEALNISTTMLSTLGIDMKRLNSKYRLNVEQWRYYSGDAEHRATNILPVFRVEWIGNILKHQTNRATTVVSATIFGATKEIVEYRVLDDSLFLHPRIQITNAIKLLRMQDSNFLNLNAEQRRSLLLSHISDRYKSMLNRFPESVGSSKANQESKDLKFGARGMSNQAPKNVHRIKPLEQRR